MCLFTRTFFLLINTLLVSLLSVSLWKFISTKLTGQGACHWPLVPGGLVTKIRCSHCQGLTSVSGWGTEILLQAAAGLGHSRSSEGERRAWLMEASISDDCAQCHLRKVQLDHQEVLKPNQMSGCPVAPGNGLLY